MVIKAVEKRTHHYFGKYLMLIYSDRYTCISFYNLTHYDTYSITKDTLWL